MQLKRFARDGMWVVVGEGLQKATKLVMAYFVARYLTTEQYGQFNYVFSLLTLLSIFGLPTSSNAIIRAVAQGRHETFEYLTRLSQRTSLIGSGLLIGYGLFEYFVRSDLQLMWLCLAAGIALPWFAIQEHWSAYLFGEGDFKRSSLLIASRIAISSILQILVMVFWWGEFKVLAFTAAMLLAFGLFNQVMSLRLYADARRRAGGILADIKHYAISTSKVESLNLFGNVYDKLLVFNFLGATEVAILAIAERLPEITKSLVKSLSNILVRMFARQNSISLSMNRAIYIAAAISLAGLLIVSLLIVPPLMTALFTERYSESILYTQILLITIPLTVISSGKFAFIKSRGNAAALNAVTKWGSIARIALSTLLVPTFGVLGAVVSTVGYRLLLLFIVQRQLSLMAEENKGEN